MFDCGSNLVETFQFSDIILAQLLEGLVGSNKGGLCGFESFSSLGFFLDYDDVLSSDMLLLLASFLLILGSNLSFLLDLFDNL